MADTVVSKTILDGNRNHVIVLQNDSDGTGEAAVTKVDVSALSAGADGVSGCVGLSVESIEWDVQGMNYVELLQGSTHLANLSGQGYKDFLGEHNYTVGDLVLTTQGAVNGGSYDITIKSVKKV